MRKEGRIDVQRNEELEAESKKAELEGRKRNERFRQRMKKKWKTVKKHGIQQVF